MSVTGTTSITVTTVQALNGRPAIPSERQATDTSQAQQVDKSTGEPVLPRFPWLSRLTRHLEHASNQAPAYQPAPLIGENLDKSV